LKRVPILTAVIAVFSFLSVSAQTGDSTVISYAGDDSANKYFEDSLLVYNYISLSKNCVSKNPDSSLILADLAMKIASQTNNLQLMADAVEQKQFVQKSNSDRIKKQDANFQKQHATSFNNYTLLIIITAILFFACIYLSILYRRKANAVKELESYKLKMDHRNRELLQFQKQTLEQNAERELQEKQRELQEKQNPKINEDVAKVNSIKDRLIPMIAHDIRSPLASLQHMLTLTRENILSPDEFQKLSVSLEADIYNLRGMLDNMLLWTREQMVEIKINKSMFDLSEAMQSVILMHRNNLISKNITIHNYLQPGLLVYSDKEIIMAVLRNILSNAVKFTEPNKNIYIHQIYLNNKIFISVKDEGKGMNPETLEKLKNSEHITTKGTANEKGTGIGIMFTKDLLKKIDESFDITSMPGSGTSVTFSISMIAEEQAAAPHA
jgi:signal transduction histidine kinase